jgi:hypothetical protein
MTFFNVTHDVPIKLRTEEPLELFTQLEMCGLYVLKVI